MCCYLNLNFKEPITVILTSYKNVRLYKFYINSNQVEKS